MVFPKSVSKGHDTNVSPIVSGEFQATFCGPRGEVSVVLVLEVLVIDVLVCEVEVSVLVA